MKKDTYEAISADSLRLGRLNATRRFPYLSSAILQLRPRPCKDMPLKTMGVTDDFVVYYHPDLHWEPEVIGTVLVHEVWHLLRNHSQRIGTRDKQLWNIAADCEINDDLRGLPLPNKRDHNFRPVFPDSFGIEDGLTAEEYYEKLLDNAEMVQVVMAEQGDGPCPSGGRCGSCADGDQNADSENSQEEDLNDGQGSISSTDIEILKRHVAEEIRKDRGNVPAGMNRWAEGIIEPQVPWQQVLRGVARRAVAHRAGADDYSYHRPSRRQSVMGNIILPKLVGNVVHVSVVIDTSGSMGGRELQVAVSETLGIIKALGTPVTVLSCDAAVHWVKPMMSANMELAGGGGTDMGLGISEADKDRNCDIIVCITDGYTPWPRYPTRSKLIVVLTDNNSRESVPDWATCISVKG